MERPALCAGLSIDVPRELIVFVPAPKRPETLIFFLFFFEFFVLFLKDVAFVDFVLFHSRLLIHEVRAIEHVVTEAADPRHPLIAFHVGRARHHAAR